jgi:hypothetical protein
MSTVAEIESEIEKLSLADQMKIRTWILKKARPQVPVMEKLRRLARTAPNLPTDLALNHDHYLHGAPKRSEG